MAINLNLLPSGFGVSGPLVKFLKTTRTLGVISLAFFLIFTLGISAFFIFSTLTLRSLNSDLDGLKSQIGVVNSTEQQVVLLKDRLGKIKTVMGIPSGAKNLDLAGPLIANLPPGTVIKVLSLDSQNISLLVQFSQSSDVSAFIKTLSDSPAFSSIIISSFKYNPVDGYLVNLIMNSK